MLRDSVEKIHVDSLFNHTTRRMGKSSPMENALNFTTKHSCELNFAGISGETSFDNTLPSEKIIFRGDSVIFNIS